MEITDEKLVQKKNKLYERVRQAFKRNRNEDDYDYHRIVESCQLILNSSTFKNIVLKMYFDVHTNVDYYIYVNMEFVMNDNYKFYIDENHIYKKDKCYYLRIYLKNNEGEMSMKAVIVIKKECERPIFKYLLNLMG
jgi:hypothetical protein